MAKLIETLRVAHGKRMKQNGVEDAEDDDVCADAEHESQYGDSSEAWRVAEDAEGVTGIEEHVFEDSPCQRGPRGAWGCRQNVQPWLKATQARTRSGSGGTNPSFANRSRFSANGNYPQIPLSHLTTQTMRSAASGGGFAVYGIEDAVDEG